MSCYSHTRKKYAFAPMVGIPPTLATRTPELRRIRSDGWDTTYSCCSHTRINTHSVRWFGYHLLLLLAHPNKYAFGPMVGIPPTLAARTPKRLHSDTNAWFFSPYSLQARILTNSVDGTIALMIKKKVRH